MSEPGFFKSECPFCGQHVEVPDVVGGDWVTCPNDNCGKSFPPENVESPTVPPQEHPEASGPSQKRNKTARVLAGISVITAVGIIASLAIYYRHPSTDPESKPTRPHPKTDEEKIDSLKAKPLMMSAEEKTSRDNILKALLDISSATALGVNRAKYGDLLTKALSTLMFEKTKLPMERHRKYLVCAAKAIDYYNQANKEWSGYFESEWMMKNNKLLMGRTTFDDLLQNGVPVDLSQYWNIQNSRDVFEVPLNEGLSLFWQAAGIYIEKMTKDVER
jgi:hypothetical protein